MKQFIYATYDTCAGIYSAPFFANSDGEVLRSFQDICSDAEHPLGKHPEHYSIHRIGTFNNIDSKLENEDPECLMTGLEAVAASRNIEPGSFNDVSLLKAQAE